MKVYLPGRTAPMTVVVAPGAHYPTSEFMNADGSVRQFHIAFKYGEAEVSEEIGRYMIDRDLAKSSPIII